jgi:endonuclease/exonuclease/phosphatase (EEP) superfamily protein YafD
VVLNDYHQSTNAADSNSRTGEGVHQAHPERTRLQKWLRRFRIIIEAGLVAAVPCNLFARLHPALDLTTHASVHLWLLCGLFLILAWITPKRFRSLPSFRLSRIVRLALLLASFLYLTAVVQPWKLIPYASARQAESGGIKVLSWNILLVNDKPDEVVKIVVDQKADIVILMEVNMPMGKKLEAIRDEYPSFYWQPAWNSGGTIILSKIPGTTFSEKPLESIGNLAIDIRVPQTAQSSAYRMLAVHTFSPVTFNRAWWRDKQLAKIRDWLTEAKEPRCAIGDFNTTPWSPGFHDLIRDPEIVDSRDGFGLLATWPSHLGPFAVPIDHALVNRSARVLDRQVIADAPGSDHRAIVVQLK